MATTRIERTIVSSGFWLQWLLANIAGWIIGMNAQSIIQLSLEAVSNGRLSEANGGFIMETTGGVFTGLGIGLLQWLVLRKYLANANGWVLATIGGWTLAGAIGGAVMDTGSQMAGGLIITVGIGLFSGFFQWLVLRRQAERAGWWILLSTFLVFISLIAGLVIANPDSAGSSSSPANILYWIRRVAASALTGAVFGSISGIVLVNRLRGAPNLERH